eukprot:TRINITY_DN2863_c0_g1_i4.p1 TRINITY_DN2863_c0_g1~~TRINITY_DN2863_c0_g1_i4.p1  ORF type:complete len:201 (-),score=31.97 TRINITY_DN2863_c0_g1_i4:96-674(-)
MNKTHLLLILLSTLSFSIVANAGTVYWSQPGEGAYDFNAAANWNTNMVPRNGDIAILNCTAATSLSVTTSAAITMDELHLISSGTSGNCMIQFNQDVTIPLIVADRTFNISTATATITTVNATIGSELLVTDQVAIVGTHMSVAILKIGAGYFNHSINSTVTDTFYLEQATSTVRFFNGNTMTATNVVIQGG